MKAFWRDLLLRVLAAYGEGPGDLPDGTVMAIVWPEIGSAESELVP
jgi:hypothetical protein